MLSPFRPSGAVQYGHMASQFDDSLMTAIVVIAMHQSVTACSFKSSPTRLSPHRAEHGTSISTSAHRSSPQWESPKSANLCILRSVTQLTGYLLVRSILALLQQAIKSSMNPSKHLAKVLQRSLMPLKNPSTIQAELA